MAFQALIVRAIFTSRLGKGQAQKLWREFSSAPVWVEGMARSGDRAMLAVHGSSRNDLNGAMVYAASRSTRPEGRFNSASATRGARFPHLFKWAGRSTGGQWLVTPPTGVQLPVSPPF